jgi:hypothetical protein
MVLFIGMVMEAAGGYGRKHQKTEKEGDPLLDPRL